jgi:hypothetical protein
MAKAMRESKETPKMEARSHSAQFLKSAVAAKVGKKSPGLGDAVRGMKKK